MNLPDIYKLNWLEINFVDYKRFKYLSHQFFIFILNK